MMLKRFVYLALLVQGLFGISLLGLSVSPLAVEANPSVPSYDCSAQADVPLSECEALVAIYNANPDGVFGSGWLEEGVAPCSWAGVTCSAGVVTDLFLGDYIDNTQLATIPPEIGDFPNLTHLSLLNNQLTSIPPEIGNLTNLGFIDLSGNQLSTLPAEIGNLTNVSIIYLNSNRLINLPVEFGDLTNMRELFLYDNLLETLPSEMENMNLEVLLFYQNELATIISVIGSATTDSSWMLDENPLGGAVPFEILDMVNQGSAFSFVNTDWCIPDGVPYQPDSVSGTGLICGQPAGAISGRITMSNAEPVRQATVALYRRYITDWPNFERTVAVTKTNAQGEYAFKGLGQDINYYVYVDPPDQLNLAPQYYEQQTRMYQGTPVTVTLGMTTTVDMILHAPSQPSVVASSDTGFAFINPIDGMLVVGQPKDQPSDLTITTTISCSDPSPDSLFLKIGKEYRVLMDWGVPSIPSETTYAMLPTGNPSEYSVTIPASDLSDLYNAVELTTSLGGFMAFTNPDGCLDWTLGVITLYERSGYITDAETNEPIAEAKVTLHHIPNWRPRKSPDDLFEKTCESTASKDPLAPWSQPAPTEIGLPVNTSVSSLRLIVDDEIVRLTDIEPFTNRLLSDADGSYGWHVPSGCWYVTVEANGYEPFVSPVVGVRAFTSVPYTIYGTQTKVVLPELDIALTPLPFCEAQTDIPQSECEALVAIYNANPDGAFGSGWLEEGVAPCSWEGVDCSAGAVTRLDLSQNQLTAVPVEIGNLLNLTELSFANNQLTTLPSQIGDLANLTTLVLANNQLSFLPSAVGDLTNLIELTIWNNRLTTLPVELGELGNLKYLSLGGNQLTAIPAEIGQLHNLEWLALEGNQLTTLPVEIENLAQLRHLIANDNLLETIPAELGTLSNLEELWLYNNELTAVPTQLGNLNNLYGLGLIVDENPLTGAIPDEIINMGWETISFVNTEWCIPDYVSPPPLAWYIGGTGRICGQLGGAISGQVTLSNTQPVNNATVALYRQDTYDLDTFQPALAVTQTNTQGQYHFDGLGQNINYYVYVDPPDSLNLPPQYHDGQTRLYQGTPITVTLGATTTVNVVLQTPQPATVMATASSETGFAITNPTNGMLIVGQPKDQVSDLTITTTISCDGYNPDSLNLRLTNEYITGGFASHLDFTMLPTENPFEYRVTISANDLASLANEEGDFHGWDAINGLSTSAGGFLTISNSSPEDCFTQPLAAVTLYERSGYIIDAETDEPVIGANVTLHHVPTWRARKNQTDLAEQTCESTASKDPLALWSQLAPTEVGLPVNTSLTSYRILHDPSIEEDLERLTRVDPFTSMQQSGIDGSYGWHVPSGCWYVTVEAEGYELFVSPVVGVRPYTYFVYKIYGTEARELLPDLDIALTPLPFCEAQTDIPQGECEALVEIYKANPLGDFGSGWLEEGVAPCSWEGVDCSAGVVTELDLSNNQLTAVSSKIGQLSNLQELWLSNNELCALTPTITNLELAWLDVSNNHLAPTDPSLITWLNTYQPDWAETQTPCPNESDPPTVTAVNPTYGFSHVATQIFIHGQNLSQPTTIYLGSIPLETIYDSDELIIAIVPAGLPVGWHDLTVQTAGGTSQLPQAYEVLPTTSDDLTATPDWLWTEPLIIREGRPGHLGLNVQRLGGTVTLEEVVVEFSLDGQVHGRGRTQPMAGNSTEVTTPLAWTPVAAGQYELCATIDPDNLIPETDETNNHVCRQITVLPPALCIEPPSISRLDIEKGALTTLTREVSLDVAAEYFCGNQAGHIRFVEFEYFLGAQRWVPITITPWLPYEAVHQDYPWTLLPTFGVRFMSAWAGDRLGNLSRTPAQDHISLVPQTQSGYVAQGGIHFYRFYLEAGQTFQATLQSVTGDADVYVWGPDGALVAFSNNESGSDMVTFPVGLTGTYQIEVVGYGPTTAEYQLDMSNGFGDSWLALAGLGRTSQSNKPTRSTPAVPVDSWPEFYAVDPPPLSELPSMIFLPLVTR